MDKNKRIGFIDAFFKNQDSYFDCYFNYLKKIDLKGNKILHLGSGWDKRNVKELFLNAEIFSLDIDYIALNRNKNSLKVCGDAHSTPFLSGVFDHVICEEFIEHVEFPDRLLPELLRILKNGGEFIFTTPGGWSYISVISKLTPLGFHKWYNRIRGVDINDVYPAFYRFNSGFTIKRRSIKNGFEVKEIKYITGYPSYFNFSKILTTIFGIFHFIVSKINFLNNLIGVNIFCVINKK